MKWTTNSREQMTWRMILIEKKLDWLLLSNSCSSIRETYRSRVLTTLLSMIRRRTKFCRVTSTTGWTTLRRSWFRMKVRFMEFSSTLRAKGQRATTKQLSKTAWLSAMRLTWTWLRSPWVCSDTSWHELNKLNWSR